ncbi:MAG: sigma 54-interacting transcriptional regulator [Sandaracinaceae bacterium]
MSTVATIHSDALGPGKGGPHQLLVIEGPDVGRVTVLDAPRIVGTDVGCDLVLTDARVSRRHVRVSPDGPLLYAVEDLESRNGTHFEGSRIERASLAVGAVIKIGQSCLRIASAPRPLAVPPSQARRFGELVGHSLAMRELFAVLELAARSDVTVLLEGETGTGKELAARGLHEASPRRTGPFVAVDCSALPPTLVDSALFGHLKGAFTGAASDRDGAFARADGGTLFLDELDSVPIEMQSRLLRAIEERKVLPLGADEERAVDVRIVAASRSDLVARVAAGDFRSDLFYRLSVMHVRIPPLRSRREDLAPIAREILVRRGLVEPGPIEGPGAELLLAHQWPGNARELRNVLDRALALTPGATRFTELRVSLEPAVAPDALRVRADLGFHEARELVLGEFERRYVADALARADGNLSAAARAIGLDRKNLRRIAQKHGLRSRDESPDED